MSEELDYLGYCKHNVCMFWMSAETDNKEIAKEVGALIRRGFDVRRGTVEQARKELAECSECKRGKK